MPNLSALRIASGSFSIKSNALKTSKSRCFAITVRRAQRVVPHRVFDHRRRERVKRHEIRHRARLALVLHDERVHDAVSRGQVVPHLRLREHRRDRKLAQVFVQDHRHPGDVLVSHLAKPRGSRLVLQLEEFYRPRHRGTRVERREVDLHELLKIQGPVPVPPRGDRSREDHARGVRSLPDPSQVDPPRDLSDEHRRQTLRAELLVNAQKVDLREVYRLAFHHDLRGHAGDERHELLGPFHADAEVPILVISRRLRRPLDKLGRVLEPEDLVVVLDVVGREEIEHLLLRRVVREVAAAPLERVRELVRLLLHVRDRDRIVDRALLASLVQLRFQLPDGLRLPERVVRDGEVHAAELALDLGEVGDGAFILVRHGPRGPARRVLRRRPEIEHDQRSAPRER
eukprot:31074-Pelagococcus_subviridis.AAC.27